MKCLLIDDEKPARDLLKNYLKDYPDIEIIQECADGFEALKAINTLKPDFVFLDIQMPKLTGIELIEVIDHKPFIIFTTAYDEFAIKAFELSAIDYLLKPFSKDRLAEALKKLKKRIADSDRENKKVEAFVNETREREEVLTRVVVKTGSKIKVIPVDEIRYLEANDDYVMIYTNDGRYLKQATMKYFEARLPVEKFIRIHRSYIVNIQQIVQMELYEKESYVVVLKDGGKLKTSKSGYKNIKEKLKF